MIFYKLYLVSPYNTEKEISNRPLLRGYKKLGLDCLIEDNQPCIFVYVDESMFVRELFTGEVLRKSSFCNNPFSETEDLIKFNELINFKVVSLTREEVCNVIPLKDNSEYIKVIQKAIFGLDNDFELTNTEEENLDRLIQIEAYQKRLTTIHPFNND